MQKAKIKQIDPKSLLCDKPLMCFALPLLLNDNRTRTSEHEEEAVDPF